VAPAKAAYDRVRATGVGMELEWQLEAGLPPVQIFLGALDTVLLSAISRLSTAARAGSS
jgi:hypothetical protein